MRISEEGPRLKNRLTGLALVMALHAFFIAALLLGAGRAVIEFTRPPMKVDLLEEKKTPPEIQNRPPPPRLLAPEPAFVPLPEITLEHPQEQAAAITVTTSAAPAATVIQPVAPIESGDDLQGKAVIEPVFEYTGCELLDYPSKAHKNHEQGAVSLLLLIDANGDALESKVVKSSGYPDLDEAARAGMGNCKYRPGKVDGRPARMLKRIHYVWQLPF